MLKNCFHKETSVKAKKSKTKSSAKKTKTEKKVQLKYIFCRDIKKHSRHFGKEVILKLGYCRSIAG